MSRFRASPGSWRWFSKQALRSDVEYARVKRATLFTIGYEQHPTPASLIAALAEEGIERVVDVRELPQSRRRGFSKTALADALGQASIAYEHVKALGNPKPYRELYKRGLLQEGRDGYREHLHNGSHPSLVELANSLTTARTCLLCLERVHEACHRDVIVEGLKELIPQLRVVHLSD